jgi:hypothetical protein
LPGAGVRPTESADDVAAALADIAVSDPVNASSSWPVPSNSGSTRSHGAFSGPTTIRALFRPDLHASYYGAELDDHSLTPGGNARIAPTRFEDWLSQSVAG